MLTFELRMIDILDANPIHLPVLANGIHNLNRDRKSWRLWTFLDKTGL